MSGQEPNQLRRSLVFEVIDVESSAPKRQCNEVERQISSQSADKLNTSTSDEGSMCTICYNDWTQSGPHRLISLKCGHLFGLECIEKWFDGFTGNQKPRCPQCNSPAARKDIRPIYAKSIRTIDTSVKDSLDAQILALKEAKCAVEKKVLEYKDQVTEMEKEIQRLREELIDRSQLIETMRTQQQMRSNATSACSVRTNSTSSKALKFRPVSRTEMGGKSRCMATNKILDMIGVSAQSPVKNPMFSGFGMVRISAHDLKHSDFIPLHKNLIKEMVFKPDDAILLSASFDKTLKLSSPVAKNVVSTIQLGEPAHSCCWNRSNTNICYVGLPKGVIAEFDIRKSDCPVNKFSGMSDTPVTSVQFVSPSEKSGLQNTPTGLLGCSLDKCYFYELNSDLTPGNSDFLPLDGKCLPLHFDHDSAFGLISHRPSANSPAGTAVTHTIFELTKSECTSSVETSIFRRYNGGLKSQIMPRSRVFMHPDSFERNGVVFAADEQSSGFLVWDTATPNVVPQVLRTDNAVLDIDLVSFDQRMRIATLTETSLTLYEKIS